MNDYLNTTPPAQPHAKIPAWWWIVLGLSGGGLLGYMLGQFAWLAGGENAAALLEGEYDAGLFGNIVYWSVAILELLATLFTQALKLIVVPLVISSVALSVARMGASGGSGIGRLGSRALLYYATTSLLAIGVGLAMVNLLSPGVVDGVGVLQDVDSQTFANELAIVQEKTAGRGMESLLSVFQGLVPSNLFNALGDNGQLLGLLTVAIAVGWILPRLANRDAAQCFAGGLQAIHDVTLVVVGGIMRLMPFGVACLVATSVCSQMVKIGSNEALSDIVRGVLLFVAVVVGGLLIHAFLILPLLLLIVGRVSPLRHYRAMLPAMLTAFSSSSSNATLPVTLECVQKRAGVSERVSGLVLPLGATVNMDGTALFECVAALFVCQAIGIELGVAHQFMVVLIALLTSIGVAGVPSASLVAIVLILGTVEKQLGLEAGLLLAGLGIVYAVDRPLDMCRTAINVLSDSVGAVLIAKREGETVLANNEE